jgi:hypothetical protein
MSAFGYTRYGQKFGVAVRDAGTRISDKLMEATDRFAVELHEWGGASLDKLFNFLYPFVGGTQVSHSYNLANPDRGRISFDDDTTVTHSANGITGPGNVDTGLTWEGGTVNDTYCVLGVYSRTATARDNYDLLIIQPVGSFHVLQSVTCRRSTDGNMLCYSGNSGVAGAYVLVAVANAQGLFTGFRNGSGGGFCYQYRNGVFLGNSTPANAGAVQPNWPASTFFLLGGGTQNLALAFVMRSVSTEGAVGQTSANQASLYPIVQRFQTRCGRAV